MSGGRRSRSREAQAWQHFYSTSQWKAIRTDQLQREPLCERCKKRGKIIAATVVHHLVPHKGDWTLFVKGPFASSCKPCHDGAEQQIERIGFHAAIGADGWPTDSNHPVNKVRRPRFSIPAGIRPSGIPVHLVCGAPASGKTTFVRDRARPGDIIIDFDDIRERVGSSRYDNTRSTLRAAFMERARMIRNLADQCEGEAWLIVMAPTHDERMAWKQALHNVVIHQINSDRVECERRVREDVARRGEVERLIVAIENYYARHEPHRPGIES